MEILIKKLDQVWTSDQQQLGVAECLYYRLTDIDPAVGFYAAYLEVENFSLGDDYYVPTDFISGRDAQGHIQLNVPFKTVLNRTWSRIPDFVAHQQARKEALSV